MDFSVVAFEYFPRLLEALGSVFVGAYIQFIFGWGVCITYSLAKEFFRQLLGFERFVAYICFFRGTSAVQIFCVYTVASQFDAVRESILWPILKRARFWCAIIAFTLNTSAFTA